MNRELVIFLRDYKHYSNHELEETDIRMCFGMKLPAVVVHDLD